MSTAIRPWLECVELHPDVLSERFSEDLFALDLGALSDHLFGKDLGVPSAELPRVPAVYRDADSFFRASYLTSGLRALLEDVLGGLTGGTGSRVLKLLTPFGGGKSHTLAALLHGARSRGALGVLPEAAGLPRPQHVRVAVVDGQFFDATTGKRVPKDDFTAKTIWGWIAWALGGREGYDVVRAQDEARVAPGGDRIIKLLRGRPEPDSARRTAGVPHQRRWRARRTDHPARRDAVVLEAPYGRRGQRGQRGAGVLAPIEQT